MTEYNLYVMKHNKVLIVDDDPRNIFALTAVLRSRGYDCKSCNNAEAAINFLKTDEPIDTLLLDMMMPEMDGYEAIPIIKQLENRSDLLIIAVTAQAMVGDREKCLETGADDYISKPVDIDKLVAVLHNR